MSFMYSIRDFSSSGWNPDEPITAEVVVAAAAANRRRRRRSWNWSLETLSVVVAARRRSWNWSLETLLVKFCWTAGNWEKWKTFGLSRKFSVVSIQTFRKQTRLVMRIRQKQILKTNKMNSLFSTFYI